LEELSGAEPVPGPVDPADMVRAARAERDDHLMRLALGQQ
jgi:hypothetical protein